MAEMSFNKVLKGQCQNDNSTHHPKGAFSLESEIRFSNLPISQKNYSKKLS